MKRLRKILKWTAIVVAIVVVIGLIANAVIVRSTGYQLQQRLADLRKAGEPVTIADLAREPIPPERNADTYLRKADDDLRAIQKELEALYPRVGYPQGTPGPAEREKLEKIFAAHPGLIPTLEQAADAPDHDPKIDVTQPRQKFLESCMDLAGRHRPLYRVLRARSALLLAQGRPDDAVATQLLMLRLTRQWRREPMLLGFLVMAVGEYVAMDVINQVLQAGPVAPETRRAIEAEAARHDTLEGYAQALRSERAFSLGTAEEIPGGSYWPLRFLSNRLKLELLGLYDRYLREDSRPFIRLAAERKAAPPARVGMLNPYRGLVVLLEPSLLSALEAADRVRAMSRSLRVLNAIQARAPASGDAVPPLGELGLPAEATTDPFDGQPLRVKKSPRGWTVYSVGANGLDDGGRLEKAIDIGVGPPAADEAAKKP